MNSGVITGHHEVNTRMRDLLSLAIKAIDGGMFVVAFALVGEVVKPKRFAGLFSAAPSVALANLLVIVAMKGHHDGVEESIGMVVGAVAFLLAAALGALAVPRLKALPGSAVTCGAWLLVAALGFMALRG